MSDLKWTIVFGNLISCKNKVVRPGVYQVYLEMGLGVMEAGLGANEAFLGQARLG